MTAFCRERELDTRAIVDLMRRTCEAVGFGHAKGIIHRDLKPGNMLVSSSGAAKIIDFGVARSTDSDRSVTMQTDVHAIVGTLQYMAPEQCTGDVLDLDTSADVYALGVTLYQLLTGQLPYEVTGQPLTSAIRIVSETAPKRIGSIDKALSGDLDVIVQKAMAKDRAQRYRTAAEFGDDLQRWLNDEPIIAAPPTLMVLVRRAIRRNKATVAAIAGMVTLLILAVAVGMFALVARNDALEARAGVLQAENQILEEQAEKREMVGSLINHFMSNTFKVIAPLSGSQEAREQLIDMSLEYIERLREQAAEDPGIQRLLAEALQQAGMNLWSMSSGNRGRIDDAVMKYEESVQLADTLHADDDSDIKSRRLSVRGRLLLYNAYRSQGKSGDSQRMLDEAEPLLDHIDLDTADIDDARSVVGIRLKRAAGSRARPDEDADLIALLETAQQVLERFPDHRGVRRDATVAWNYAGFAWAQHQEHEKSLEMYNRSLAERQSLLKGAQEQNTARRDVLNVHRYVCGALTLLNRLDEVLEAYELDIVPLARTLSRKSATDSRARKDLANVLAEQAVILDRLKRHEEGLPLLMESREHWMKVVEDAGGDMSNDYWTTQAVLRVEIDLTRALLQSGQISDAEATVDRAVALGRNAQTTWPDQGSIKSMYDEARKLRARIIEATTADQP